MIEESFRTLKRGLPARPLSHFRLERIEAQASIVQHKTSKAKYRLPSVFSDDAARIYKALGLKRDLDLHIDPS